MRKLWTVAVFAAAVAVAVGGLGTPAFAAKSKPKTTPTTAQLQAALLALDDMPTGFAADTTPPSTTGPCNGPTVKSLTDAGAIAPGVNADFSKNQTVGPLVSEGLVAYPTVAAAKHAFVVARDAYLKCPTSNRISDSGTAYHVENTAESFPKAGDQTAAIRTVVHPQSDLSSISAQGDVVFIRKGNVLVGIFQGGLGLDGSLTTQMAGKAMKKLGRLGS